MKGALDLIVSLDVLCREASVRGGITWEDVCALTIPVPPISEQRKIVRDYQVITGRIELLRKIDSNLFQTAKTHMV